MNIDKNQTLIRRGRLFIFTTRPHGWEDYRFWTDTGQEPSYLPVRLPKIPPPKPKIKIYPPDDPMESIGLGHLNRGRRSHGSED